MTEKTSNIRQKRQNEVHERQQAKSSGPVGITPQASALALQMAVQNPAAAPTGALLKLQRISGNRAVQGLIQAKMTVGAANDSYEQEADRMASTVINMPEPGHANGGPLQRSNSEEEEPLQGKPLAASVSRLVQRDAAPEEEEVQTKSSVQREASPEEEEVQTKPALQREAAPEEEEVQTKPALQREAAPEEEEVQTKPALQRQPIDPRSSFEAGAGIERQIQAQQGGGAPLPPDVQGFMETRFGADFSQVRVHTDPQAAQLNRSLSAQAFTHGSEIFMGEGRFDPGTSGGKELLAHELTHTIQQGASPLRAQRSTPTASCIQASSVVTGAMLQLKLALVSDKAQTRLPAARPTGTPAEQVKLVEKSPKGQTLNKNDTINLSNDPNLHVKDASGNIAWYRTTKTPAREYIRGEKVVTLEAPGTGVAEEDEGEKLGTAVKENVFGTVTDSFTTVTDDIDESVKDIKDKKDKNIPLTDAENEKYNKAESQNNKLGIASGVFSTTGGILGMALAIKSLGEGKDLKSKVDAIFDLVGSGADTISGLATFSSKVTASESVSNKAEAVGKWSDSVAGMLGTLQKGISTIINVVSIIKMIADDKKYSKDEYLQKGSELLGNALATAKGVVSSIAKIYDALGDVATSALQHVVIGLDIAISAVKAIMEGYYLAVSARQWYLMSGRGKEMTQQLASTPQKQAGLKEASEKYSSNEAMIVKIESMKKLNLAKITKIDTQRAAILSKTPRTARDTKKLADLDAKKLALTTENTGFDTKKAAHQKAITDYEAAHSDMSREKLEEYGLVGELGTANRKRVVRQSIHIGSELLKIGGGIANLTGMGASVGVALKASAAGIDLSLPLFRSLKQWGRNIAAENLAKGETGISNKIFNADKNTVAKMEARKGHAIVILKLVAKLADYIPKSSNQAIRAQEGATLTRHINQVEGYIRAAGCEPVTLYRANGNAAEQVKILAKALARREFSSE